MYDFDVSYPKDATDATKLNKTLNDILRQFPNCEKQTIYLRNLSGKTEAYETTICKTSNAQDIINVATALKKVDSKFFIAVVSKDGEDFYYNPVEIASLDPQVKAAYTKLMQNLPTKERTLHDYLVNLYMDVPT